MACARCGEVCHCYTGVRTSNGAQMRPRFEIDIDDPSSASSAVLIDPERYDATEEQFSASLDAPSVSAPRFVPDQPTLNTESEASGTAVTRARAQTNRSTQASISSEPAPTMATITAKAPDIPSEEAVKIEIGKQPIADGAAPQPFTSGSSDAWKEELAARLNSYRAKRRPRPPKYPSLSLEFEPPAEATSRVRISDSRTSLAIEDSQQKLSADAPKENVRVVPVEEDSALAVTSYLSGQLIEFPRFFSPPEASPDQLADPVCEHPRILDAPEVELPAPALGGIVLETQQADEEERPGFEMPLRSAPISRRLLAAAADFIVIMIAGTMFSYIFLQFAKALPSVPHLLASAALVGSVLWVGYQYILLTYSGSTPGLQLGKLQLLQFDGSAVPRSRRTWRVIASLLSAVSLGLGFAWCLLDEDALCWHDRITRTHLVLRD